MARLTYSVVAAYESLVEALDDAASKANCGSVTSPPSIRGRFAADGLDSVTFDCYLHLANWKSRREHSGRISIVVHVLERIRVTGAAPTLLSSTVRLYYFRTDGRTATLAQSIHFDYGPPQKAHPLFHAQVGGEQLDLLSLAAQEVSFQYAVGDLQPDCFAEGRIPTSDMTFPSVLLCLAADHLDCDDEHDKRFFLQFRSAFHRLQGRLPQPAFEQMKESLAKSPDHLRSSHWFAHMPEETNDASGQTGCMTGE